MASEDTVSHAGYVRQSSVLSPLPETAQRTRDLQMWWHVCIDELEKALGNWFRDLGSALIGPPRSQIWTQRYHQMTLHEGLSFLEFMRSQMSKDHLQNRINQNSVTRLSKTFSTWAIRGGKLECQLLHQSSPMVAGDLAFKLPLPGTFLEQTRLVTAFEASWEVNI